METEKNDYMAKGGMLPFTLYAHQNKQVKQIIALTLSIYVLPKRVISFLLKKRLYRFFPSFYNYNLLYNLVEIVPFFIKIFTFKKYWFPVRRSRHRYIFFIRKRIASFFKKNKKQNTVPA